MAGVAPAAKPLRILILGGTGFTGPHQVRYALARGHKLTLFNRGRRPKEWPGEVEELSGDRNTGDLEGARGARVGRLHRQPDDAARSGCATPGRCSQGKVGQYVFISTVSVYATEEKAWADESAPTAEYKGADAMAETMEAVRAEQLRALRPAQGATPSARPRSGSRARPR